MEKQQGFTLPLHTIPRGHSSLFTIKYSHDHHLLVDTGAVYTIIDDQFASEYLKTKPKGISQPVFTPGGNKLQVRSLDFEFLGAYFPCYSGDIGNWLRLFSFNTIGILGNDILHRGNARINLKKLTIHFSIITH